MLSSIQGSRRLVLDTLVCVEIDDVGGVCGGGGDVGDVGDVVVYSRFEAFALKYLCVWWRW